MLHDVSLLLFSGSISSLLLGVPFKRGGANGGSKCLHNRSTCSAQRPSYRSNCTNMVSRNGQAPAERGTGATRLVFHAGACMTRSLQNAPCVRVATVTQRQGKEAMGAFLNLLKEAEGQQALSSKSTLAELEEILGQDERWQAMPERPR